MVAQLLLLITDADAVPGFGLSFYCPAAADAEITMAVSLAATITDVDVTGFGLSSYCSAVAEITTDADANSRCEIGSEKSLFFCISADFIS